MQGREEINLLDTPGNFDFAGEALSGIRAARYALLVCGAKDSLSVGAERVLEDATQAPTIFITRTDEDNSDYNACLDALKAKFGTAVAPIVVPRAGFARIKKVTGIVDLLHNKAYEVKGGKTVSCAIPAAVADDVEGLSAPSHGGCRRRRRGAAEKFFETMELTAEIAKGLKAGNREGTVAPVLAARPSPAWALRCCWRPSWISFPWPPTCPPRRPRMRTGKEVTVAIDPNGTTAAIVFKTSPTSNGGTR